MGWNERSGHGLATAMSEGHARPQRTPMALIDLANPTRFLAIADHVMPWLAAATLFGFALGLGQVILVPDDYQQGATVKILFIHAPAAWLSLFGWTLMSVAALGTLVWRHPL